MVVRRNGLLVATTSRRFYATQTVAQPIFILASTHIITPPASRLHVDSYLLDAHREKRERKTYEVEEGDGSKSPCCVHVLAGLLRVDGKYKNRLNDRGRKKNQTKTNSHNICHLGKDSYFLSPHCGHERFKRPFPRIVLQDAHTHKNFIHDIDAFVRQLQKFLFRHLMARRLSHIDAHLKQQENPFGKKRTMK